MKKSVIMMVFGVLAAALISQEIFAAKRVPQFCVQDGGATRCLVTPTPHPQPTPFDDEAVGLPPPEVMDTFRRRAPFIIKPAQ